MARTAAENEASVQAFRRERVAHDVQIAHVTLRRGESSLLHSHSRTQDTFYIVAGRLTVTVHEHEGSPRPAFHTINALPADVREASTGRINRIRLVAGDVLVIEPGVVHCAANLEQEACSFLCIEGVGEYDFILAEGS